MTRTFRHHDRLREPGLLQETPPGFELDQWMVGAHGVIGPLGPALGQAERDVEPRQRAGAFHQHQPSARRQQAGGVADGGGRSGVAWRTFAATTTSKVPGSIPAGRIE